MAKNASVTYLCCVRLRNPKVCKLKIVWAFFQRICAQNFGGLWLGYLRRSFVFRCLCGIRFNSIAGLLQKTLSFTLKQSLVCSTSV